MAAPPAYSPSLPLAARIIRRVPRFRERLKAWYKRHGRSFPWRQRGRGIYELVIAEVLLQRTRAEVVSSFYPLFLETFPSWGSLARARPPDLRKLLQPIGLWRRRAVALVALARAITARGGRVPSTREGLECLPGVGQYVANAVQAICYGAQEPMLDVNMARVLERYFGPRNLSDIRYDPYLQELSRKVLAGEDPKKLNWALLDFGAVVCRARNPRCEVCPLRSGCAWFWRNRDRKR